MKQIITYLRRTGRRVSDYLKRLLGKATHEGRLRIGITVGIPPFVSITFGYDVKFSGKADNDNTKISETG
ncbi:trans-acting factor B [Pararhizobium haloflavum]|uniref:trans-acting factor B n=1 Tax=Pararhizobium haloflavum TaxID=2037914 RepID=UPI000C17AB21|nr:trans-acting factor B [Pararhizobium haloflavum]